MRFNLEEFGYFREWFEIETRKGAKSFLFPDIELPHATYKFDESDFNKEYRFIPSSSLGYSNSKGQFIDVSMEWEEV